MKKIKDLTVADFPGVDPQQFAAWHQAELTASRHRIIVLVIMIIINIAVIFTGIGVFFGGMLLFLILYLIARTPNRLLKAMGLTPAHIKRARQGNLVPVAVAGLTQQCPQCAAVIQAETRFCRYCGYAFSAAAVPAQQTIAGQAAPTAAATAALQQQHYKITSRLTTLKILYYIAAGFSALMVISSLAIMLSKDQPNSQSSGAIMLVISLITVALCILTAWSIGQRKPWARTLAIVVGICSLLAVPLGTALGIFTLIVMYSEAGKQAFAATS